MNKINIQFTLFSAFYSPLIVTMAGGFLKREGLEYEWSISPPGVAAVDSITDGSAHVVQSAPSQAFNAIARGEIDYPLHFAQINEMDGFFISARDPDDDFDWRKLQDAEAVIFGGGQPNAMLRYACHQAGIDFNRIGGRMRLTRRFVQARVNTCSSRDPIRNSCRPMVSRTWSRRWGR
jgi:NitT/TauT family transport system substrate-binding protein